jgi:hypothetical protein
VTWSSNNESVATVTPGGAVSGHTAGTAIITVKTDDGNHTADCVVTVTVPEAGVAITAYPSGLLTGQAFTFTANQAVTWSASVPGGFANPAQGNYIAPATITGPYQIIAITATSVANPSQFARVEIRVTAIPDLNSKTNPQLLGFANAIGSTLQADLDEYDLNGDGKIDSEDLLIFFTAMGWL